MDLALVAHPGIPCFRILSMTADSDDWLMKGKPARHCLNSSHGFAAVVGLYRGPSAAALGPEELESEPNAEVALQTALKPLTLRCSATHHQHRGV